MTGVIDIPVNVPLKKRKEKKELGQNCNCYFNLKTILLFSEKTWQHLHFVLQEDNDDLYLEPTAGQLWHANTEPQTVTETYDFNLPIYAFIYF